MKRLFDSSQIWLLKAEWITFKLLPITTAGAVDAICNAGDAEMLWVPAEAIARILSCDFDLNRDCKRVLRELQLLDTLRLMGSWNACRTSIENVAQKSSSKLD